MIWLISIINYYVFEIVTTCWLLNKVEVEADAGAPIAFIFMMLFWPIILILIAFFKESL